MNWGKKIALAYGSFAAFMLVLVYLCYQKKDMFLVTPNYYQKELAYEETISAIKNARNLSQEVEITYQDGGLLLSFPQESKGSTGNIHLYRPSNANRDINIPLNLDKEASQSLNTSKLIKGLWVIKMDWQKAGVAYYKEQKITL